MAEAWESTRKLTRGELESSEEEENTESENEETDEDDESESESEEDEVAGENLKEAGGISPEKRYRRTRPRPVKLFFDKLTDADILAIRKAYDEEAVEVEEEEHEGSNSNIGSHSAFHCSSPFANTMDIEPVPGPSQPGQSVENAIVDEMDDERYSVFDSDASDLSDDGSYSTVLAPKTITNGTPKVKKKFELEKKLFKVKDTDDANVFFFPSELETSSEAEEIGKFC